LYNYCLFNVQIISEHSQEIGKVVVRVNIFRDHRQCIQYILPTEDNKLAQAELVAIDEAAAIPLPTVRKLMNSGTYLCFLSSTINGYEGTGRSLSLKLISQLRQQQGQAMANAAKQAGQAVVGPKSNKGERHLHEDRWKAAAAAASSSAVGAAASVRKLTELALDEPIRYSSGDPIEKWLNSLLCLDCASNGANTRLLHVMPSPKDCELYMVNRDALFSYHALSESLLQRIWALYTAAHYKNSPNDLQMLSDAPAHRLFVLLGPQRAGSSQLPDVLCVVQIAFEGFISQQSIQSEIQRGNKASGDMIPWTLSQQFNDNKFASLSGVRIVRIATHPDVQKMGYGSRAIDIICSYFRGELSLGAGRSPEVGEFGGEGAVGDEVTSADDLRQSDSDGLRGESLKPRKKLPPLMTALADRPSERLHWMGVSFGLTTQLLNFWSRKAFKTCYLRQTKNDLTGEHSCIVLKELKNIIGNGVGSHSAVGRTDERLASGWLEHFVSDYRRRLVSLMSYSFSSMETSLAITLIDPDRVLTSSAADVVTDGDDDAVAVVSPCTDAANGHSMAFKLTAQELVSVHLSQHDLKRLDLYSRNMVDHHMILDTIPVITRLLFLQRIEGVRLSFLQVAIILAVGLQHRDVDSVATELDIPASQVLAFFNKTVRKIAGRLSQLVEADIAKELAPSYRDAKGMEKKVKQMDRLAESLSEDQNRDEKEFLVKAKESKELSKHVNVDKATKVSSSIDAALAGSSKIPSRISVAVPVEPKPVKSSEGATSKKKDKKRKDVSDDGASAGIHNDNAESDQAIAADADDSIEKKKKKPKKDKSSN
jgi:N-acetyltransferase 10